MSNMFRNTKALLALLGLVGLLSLSAMAQTFRGGISGVVTDGSGGVVPNATVTATADDTGLVHTTTSSSAGEYGFQDLPLGKYTVSTLNTGFQPLVVKDVILNGGVIYSLPLKLSILSVSTTVEVSAAALALDTQSSVQNSVVSGALLQDLPLDSRDFKRIVSVLPGFGGYSGIVGSFNGTRASQTNFQIDGTDNNDLWANNLAFNQGGVAGIAGTLLPIDAIDQFSVQTQSNAETGRNPGATENLIIKSGTNQFHGTAYYFNRNEALAAAPLFGVGQKLRNENYGYSLGGPFLKNKLFFFTSFERQQFVIGVAQLVTEPSTAYQVQAEALLAANGIAVNPVQTSILATIYPASALTGPAAPNNFVSPDPETGYSNNGVAKLDYSINDKNTISARWIVGQGNQIAPVGSNLKNFYEVAPIHIQNYSVVYNRTISSRLVNQVLLGVSAYNQAFHDFNTSFNLASLGLVTGATFTGSPSFNISNFDGTGETPPEGRNDVTGHVTDALSYNVGAHQFRFGGEYRKAQLDEFYFRNSLGTFTFDGTQGNYPKGTNANVASLADFIAGRVSRSTFASGDAERLVYVNTYDVFAQDAWQLTRKLNVNYGIRYDYVGPLHDGDKDLPTFVPTFLTGPTPGLPVQGQDIANLYAQDHNSFAPRFGFAYQPRDNGGLVVRGAFGVYFDSSPISPFFDNRPANGGPNGFEGNPAGANPVQTISHNAYTIRSGVSTFPGGPAAIRNIFSVDPNFRTPYTYNFTFGIEQSLGSKAQFMVSYVGNESRKQLTTQDINQTPLSSVSTTPNQAARPYYNPFSTYGVINQVESNGTGNYNSLQATVKTSSYHGVSSQFSYTWSHSLDEDTAFRGRLPQDSTNLKGDYGNSDYDIRNNFNGAVFYNLPRLGRAPTWIAAGWQVNSAASFRGGLPFNIATSSDTTGTGEGYQRPNLVGNPLAGVSHALVGTRAIQFINPAAFALPAVGTFGDLRRNQIYGPGFGDIDLSVFKNTKIRENVTLQLRVEMFNLFNQHNYGQPGGTFSPTSSSFGTVGSTTGVANGAPGIGPGEPFNTQLAGKIIF